MSRERSSCFVIIVINPYRDGNSNIVLYKINGLQNELNPVETDSRGKGVGCGVNYFRTTL